MSAFVIEGSILVHQSPLLGRNLQDVFKYQATKTKNFNSLQLSGVLGSFRARLHRVTAQGLPKKHFHELLLFAFSVGIFFPNGYRKCFPNNCRKSSSFFALSFAKNRLHQRMEKFSLQKCTPHFSAFFDENMAAQTCLTNMLKEFCFSIFSFSESCKNKRLKWCIITTEWLLLFFSSPNGLLASALKWKADNNVIILNNYKTWFDVFHQFWNF